MLLEPSPAHAIPSQLAPVEEPSRSSKWLELLEVDWRPRNFEIVFLGFGAIYLFLISQTHLPLSWFLAKIFIMQVCIVTLTALGLSVPLVLGKAAYEAWRYGVDSLKSQEAVIQLIRPYWTLNFLMLTIRRAFCLFGSIYFFLHLKHLILWLNPSNNDLTLWDLDRMLHFGVQPNIKLMELISPHQELAVLLDWLYIKYFSYKLLISMCFLLELRGRKLTDAYFCAYCALWSFGGLGYVIYPADGPCYAVLVEHSISANIEERRHPFRYPVTSEVPQSYIDQYRESKIWTAKAYQYQLWNDRRTFLEGKRLPGFFYGIAAMPSLHVAAVTMIAIFVFKLSSIAGMLAVVYAITTFIGSIFLQWHYALDGYVGFLMAVCVSILALRLPEAIVKKEKW